ncbi:hypothetical protein [Aneurinibacillus tyrosinisolvens]|uniref:hypothetical protein n=1 Tax=Aneurinibacillus tyrosinisolvens TaxID=1443435 RepID=UPI00063EEF37|nr:hypothetical protein [Aneurinibacillus tyrosinisolvens]
MDKKLTEEFKSLEQIAKESREEHDAFRDYVKSRINSIQKVTEEVKESTKETREHVKEMELNLSLLKENKSRLDQMLTDSGVDLESIPEYTDEELSATLDRLIEETKSK